MEDAGIFELDYDEYQRDTNGLRGHRKYSDIGGKEMYRSMKLKDSAQRRFKAMFERSNSISAANDGDDELFCQRRGTKHKKTC